MEPFRDRAHAGRLLGDALQHRRASWPEPLVVVGIPRGGVPVAAEVAARLAAPLEAVVVRKLGVPGRPELAMGAVGQAGAGAGAHAVVVRNDDVIEAARVDEAELAAVVARESAAVERRAARWRTDASAGAIHDATVVLVDDGIATGATVAAAGRVLRALGAARAVLAAPVASPQALSELDGFDEVVVLSAPVGFEAVGSWYLDFTQTPDEDVDALLRPRPRH
ncbi:phosphoribosyltransferase [Agromyces soli]|uniref:Phosphoribosyltransferase n=1 Tax=Agromyces soli TaxID=659012 RepID=A0ABY4AVP4_9MICO|nr:phosphoribosyltransferase family protein [Agromyces soli]UOE24945.1 phosphoribosyltransferase [Agromyces soli]